MARSMAPAPTTSRCIAARCSACISAASWSPAASPSFPAASCTRWCSDTEAARKGSPLRAHAGTLPRMEQDRSYVIGTHDAEIERLGVQHRVWRSSVLDFWLRGGLTEGMTVIDAGAGPGHATLDLAEIGGPPRRVIALERSRRFLDALEARAAQRVLANIQTIETDLADFDWTSISADRL